MKISFSIVLHNITWTDMCNFACVFAFYWIESYIRVRIQAIFHTKKQTFQDYLLLKLVHSSDTLHRGQFTIWNQNNFQVKYCNKLQDSCWIQEKHKQSFIEQHSKTSKISKYLMSNSMKLLLLSVSLVHKGWLKKRRIL